MHTDAKIGYEDRYFVSADSNAVYVHMFFSIYLYYEYDGTPSKCIGHNNYAYLGRSLHK